MLPLAKLADYNAIQSALTVYARAYIEALRAQVPQPSFEAIAKRLSCSKAWVQQLHNTAKYGDRTVGAETVHTLAELHHGGSIDALRGAAKNLAAGGTVVVEENGERMILTPPRARPVLVRRELP